MFGRNPHLMNRMPSGGRAASAWFRMLSKAIRISPDFAEWCVRKIDFQPPYEESIIDVTNIGDWIEASYKKHVHAAVEGLAQRLEGEVPAQYVERRLRDVRSVPSSGDRLVTRTFKRDMSARTVFQLSNDWHDAVADQQFSGDVLPFPRAWTPATEIGEYQIVPLETPRDLYCEGKAMHNCVTTF